MHLTYSQEKISTDSTTAFLQITPDFLTSCLDGKMYSYFI